MTPDEDIAIEALYNLAEAIEGDLKSKNGIVSRMIVDARREAVAAMSDLLIVDAADTIRIQLLQNTVKRYSDLVNWIISINAQAHEALNVEQIHVRNGVVEDVIYSDDNQAI